jgi:hypothetical protein
VPASPRSSQRSADFERLLAAAVRAAGWRLLLPRQPRGSQPDLLIEAEGRRFLVQLKVASEGRRDRLMPLLSQAILQAQAAVRQSPEPLVAMAIVAATRIPATVADQIADSGRELAPDVGVGVIDAGGLRVFRGQGLEALNARPARKSSGNAPSSRSPQLFSDLNQWMLKVLLGQRLSPVFITVPQGDFDNASRLAEASGVSVMSAFRLVRRLAEDGFLDEAAGRVEVARVEDLLDLWAAANRQAIREVPARWIIRRDPRHLNAVLAEYATEFGGTAKKRGGSRTARSAALPPRCCLGLFAAADALGLGVVRGIPPHIYLERLDLDVLERIGLRVADSAEGADAIVRIPANREAVFRACAKHDGVFVSDVMQIWLDVSTHPTRGREQAAEIRRRALRPMFGKA